MKKKNTLGKVEYVVTYIWCVFPAMFLYQSVLFVRLQGCTTDRSMMILRLTVYSLVLLGIVCTFKKYRNYTSVTVNTLLPFELYAVMSYMPYHRIFITVVLVLSGALLTFYFLAVMLRRVKKRTQTGEIYANRFKTAMRGSQTLLTLCLLIFFVPVGARSVLGIRSFKTSEPSVASFEVADEWTVENNIDVVRLLREEEWSKLDTQEKLDVLGVITNIEIRYLGINHGVRLTSDKLENNINAYYNDRDHEIVIDLSHLNNSSAHEVLHSLLHEMCHVYQHVQIEMLDYVPEEYRHLRLFDKLNRYAEEFGGYIDGNDDYPGYSQQSVEVTARAYADEAMPEYYELIEKYTAQS